MATKMTFRHIGYYNDYEDVKNLFGRTANYVVQTMLDGLGAFHRVTGESETDIDDHKIESDADKFVKTENGNYLVRFERGSENGEGWFIDIYKLMEVEVEDTGEDDDNKVYEYCSYCENEVILDNEFKVQVCPDCGHAIVPCSICPLDSCCTNCPLDVLCRQKNDEIEEVEGILEVTLSSFIEMFEKQLPSNQASGYTIFIQETDEVNAHRLLFRYDFDYGVYILTNITHNGQAYTWDETPSPGSFFDGLWNVSGQELDSFKVKPNFD